MSANFDPLQTPVHSYEIHRLSGIAERARLFLRTRNSGEVRAAQQIINDRLHSYYEARLEPTESCANVDRVLDDDPRPFLPYGPVGSWSDVDALKLCIYANDADEEAAFPGGAPTEYFAAFALGCVEEALSALEVSDGDPEGTGKGAPLLHGIPDDDLRGKPAAETVPALYRRIAIDAALNAMSAINYAELWLTARDLSSMARHERSERAMRGGYQRHAKSAEAKRLVQAEWERDTTAFPGAEQAGDYFAVWLEERGYSYSQRTVRDWIRERASELGIKWR
ncbi:hypothetical protein [Cupriavidus metallidurans]|uniref:hypothetical protein n=1 Tax=Cupriavidus metallidurans TaxID=119219 RepID=UPI00056C65C3|nr:hypothetical protein [Cupriavidus metallidurans]